MKQQHYVTSVAMVAMALTLVGCQDDLPTEIPAPTLVPSGPAFTTIGTTPTLTTSTVNNSAGDQTDPHISGSLVSYTSNADGTNRIRYHNLGTGADAVVPNAGEDDFLSDISGSKVVFTRLSAQSAIYVYEVGAAAATEVAASGDVNRRNPSIGGNTVAWQDFGFNASALQPEIVVSDLATGTTTRLTTDALLDRSPAVSPDGAVVVWASCQTTGAGCNIWRAVKSGSSWTASAITGSEGEESNPDTDGQIIVYASTRSGETDIYWQPVAGGAEQRLELAGTQSNPSVSDGLITFDSRGATDWDVWAYDTATDIAYRLTATSANETLNDVWVSPSGLVRVVYASDATGDSNVHAISFQRPEAALYSFTGFFPPVDNSPVVNKAKAGSAIPVKFSLGGNHGLDIFAEGYPLSSAGTCDQTASDIIEETVTAGGSSLQYDPAAQQYTYVWKTDKAWTGTCRQLVVGLNDGTTHTAWFNFK
jgi:hypothetical protein